MEKKFLKILLIILIIYSSLHFIYSGIYKPMFIITGSGATGQVDEEAAVLKEAMDSGKKITDLNNPRQYGPIFLFGVYPALKFFPAVTEWYLLIIGYFSLAFAFYFCWKALFKKRKDAIWMIILWFNFSPVYHILQVKNVELWELFFISVALFAVINARSLLAGIMIALGALTKFFPGAYVLYFIFKDKKALLWTAVSGVIILLVSGFFLGPAIGITYPFKILLGQIGKESWATPHFENNSIKGIVHKIFSGFHAENYLFQVRYETAAFVISLILQLTLLGFLCFLLAKKWSTPNEKLIKFGLIAPASMLFAPLAAHEYGLLLLPSFTIMLYLYITKKLTKTTVTLTIMSYLLIGQFLPSTLIMRVIPWGIINSWLGNTQFTLLESWRAYGMPFLGFVLLFVAFAALLIQNAKSATFKNKQSV